MVSIADVALEESDWMMVRKKDVAFAISSFAISSFAISCFAV